MERKGNPFPVLQRQVLARIPLKGPPSLGSMPNGVCIMFSRSTLLHCGFESQQSPGHRIPHAGVVPPR